MGEMARLEIALLVQLAAMSAAHTDVLRIGAWNIQDFHHEEDFSLRSFGSNESVKRTTEDFEALGRYRDLFGRSGTPADVVALQEIGTKDALDRLFPPTEYDTLMSPRWPGMNPQKGEVDVYTAIAVRSSSGVEIVEEAHLPELSVFHTDQRPTRAGTGALLRFDGVEFWFLSVHLKSSCADTKSANTSISGDCKTLWSQIPILRTWIKEKQITGIPLIIAGDFNRRFRRFQSDGPVWKALNDRDPDQSVDMPLFSRHPLTVTRLCPTKKGNSTQPIDWILLDRSLDDAFVEGSFWERRFTFEDVTQHQYGSGLSDHCPISVDVDFGRL